MQQNTAQFHIRPGRCRRIPDSLPQRRQRILHPPLPKKKRPVVRARVLGASARLYRL